MSACLLGECCKYSGGHNLVPALVEALQGYEVVPVCPEMLGGLACPRDPAEIVGGRVVSRNEVDVTEEYELGAARALELARGCDAAVLQPRSPSCGVHQVYDGGFSGALVPGSGLFARALARAGVDVYEPEEFLDLDRGL